MSEESKMVSLVYFGKKSPKIIKTVPSEQYEQAKEEDKRKSADALKARTEHIGVSFIPLAGKSLIYKFIPFKAINVDDRVAKVLLNAGSLFRRVDEERKPKEKAKISTKGYVGDVHAENIKDLDKTTKKEQKEEEGKSVEDIIKSSKKDKEG